VTLSAAILALSLLSRPPLALTREAERLELPPSARAVRIEARPFTREWVLLLPPSAVAPTALQLRGASRICPEVIAGADRVTLRCTTSRVRASVVRDAAGTGIDLFRLSIPSWRPEDEGPPLVPFDLTALRLGACPGDAPELQGECALAAGDLDGAKERFEQAIGAGPSALARLRLGDLALRADDPSAAVAHWRLARAEAPWGRLASARLCELEPKCLASQAFEAVYDTSAVERALRSDLLLRRARLAALDGELLQAAQRLSAESVPGGACQALPGWCRRLILLSLELPGPDGIEALTAYLELWGRREGPLALELTRAAARQAERAGAPAFAANVLAATTGTIPPEELELHLRRVAGLYLAAGDRARADEIVRYARSKLGAAAMGAPAWAALRRRVRGAPTAARAAPPTQDPDLADARGALDAARLVTSQQPLRKGATP
jgi:hypothetical protein